MSNKAEQAAKEIYKDGIQLFGRRDKNNNLVIHPETMVGILRSAAEKGYEQAEKDHSLKWEDIQAIVKIVLARPALDDYPPSEEYCKSSETFTTIQNWNH